MRAAGGLREVVTLAVKRLLVQQSRLSMAPEQLSDSEHLAGELLQVNSLGFVGMLIKLEDELDVTLLDDFFVGHDFHTVADLVKVVMLSVQAGSSP